MAKGEDGRWGADVRVSYRTPKPFQSPFVVQPKQSIVEPRSEGAFKVRCYSMPPFILRTLGRSFYHCKQAARIRFSLIPRECEELEQTVLLTNDRPWKSWLVPNPPTPT